jgi:hypothetical protein
VALCVPENSYATGIPLGHRETLRRHREPLRNKLK